MEKATLKSGENAVVSDYDWVIFALRLQMAYWSYNPFEKEVLLSGFPDDLTWPELLRLHHLVCMELFLQAELLRESAGTGNNAATRAAQELCKKLVEKLSAADSPYKACRARIWQNEGKNMPLEGQLNNASLTHPGCVEVIRLNADGGLQKVDFVALSTLGGIEFGQVSMFRAGRLLTQTRQTEEVVLVPVQYGMSWFTANTYDQDGSMTRFCCHLNVESLGHELGIGIGQQDLLLNRGTLLGLASVARIELG